MLNLVIMFLFVDCWVVFCKEPADLNANSLDIGNSICYLWLFPVYTSLPRKLLTS